MIFSDTTPVKVLIIDDDEDDFFLTESLIKSIDNSNFQVDWSFNYKDAYESILQKKYDLYFIDYYLGAKTGLDLLKESILAGCDDPMILLTGKGNRTVDIEAMRNGAADYLVKADLNLDLIERSIRYSLENGKILKTLKKNELRYRSIFENTKDAIFLTNKDLYFSILNPSTANILKYSAEELYEKSFYDLIIRSEDKEQLLKELSTKDSVTDYEVVISNKDGEEIYVIFSCHKIDDISDSHYYQAILHDITSIKKAEKALVLSEKLAATDRLARTLAHEIRNPLTNILLSLDNLMQQDSEEEVGNYYQIINRSAGRIGSIISELLDTARPTSLEFKNHILQEVVEESLLAAKDRILLKKIELNVDFEEDNIVIYGDKEKLKIAFLNIIINAVEAMEEEKGKLNIKIVKNAENKVELYICDNGVGIPKENLIRLFEPYFTAKKSGLGLGLAATLNILQGHKADVDVKSELGEGTQFCITMNII